MLRFAFNAKAIEAFAKELRRASWGVTVAAVAGGIRATDWTPSWVVIGGAGVWLVLQCTAVAFGIAFAIITIGSLGSARFVLWLRNRDAQQRRASRKRPKHA